MTGGGLGTCVKVAVGRGVSVGIGVFVGVTVGVSVGCSVGVEVGVYVGVAVHVAGNSTTATCRAGVGGCNARTGLMAGFKKSKP